MRLKTIIASASLVLSAFAEQHEERYPNAISDVTVVIDYMTFGGAAGSVSREAFIETDKLVDGKPYRLKFNEYTHESSAVPQWTEEYLAKFCVDGQDRTFDVQVKAGVKRVRFYC